MVEFGRDTVIVDVNKVGDMGRAIIAVFERYDASAEESIICLDELKQMIKKQSGIVSLTEIDKPS